VGRNIRGAVLARDLDDLRQVALDDELQGALIRSLRYFGHVGGLLEPFHRGWGGEGDLHVPLADGFER